ncbi:hypothetical protein [Niallia sp. 03133]|uniref:hypothetical protein n=1 Tax=Niallia sp. 03133 TaxID=3458060 RepID=UPI00404440D3
MNHKRYLIGIYMFFLLIVTGCTVQSSDEPPAAIVKIKDEKMATTKGGYSWEKKGLFSNHAVIADAAAPLQIAEDLNVNLVKPNSAADVVFSDGSHPQLHAYLWEGEQRGKELAVKKQQLSLPSEEGKYVIELFAEWPNGDSSYTFVVEIK